MNWRTSSYAPRFLALAAIAALAVTFFAVPAHAQILCTSMSAPGCTLSFVGGTLDNPTPGAINPSGWTPTLNGGTLELTSNNLNQRGAAWFNTQQQVAGGFGVEFQFRITTAVGVGGDGLAFVIQNSGSGLSAIGGFGGGIGYGTREFDPCTGLATAAQYSISPCAAGTDLGIPNSVAIEFDTFQNSYDGDADHVAIQSCGTANNLADHTSPCLITRSGSLQALPNPINLADGNSHYAQIVYLPFSATCPTANPCPNLFVYVDPAINPAPVVQAHVDLNNPCTAAGCPAGTILNNGTAWVGFTAATRGAQSEHDLLSFTFSPSITQPLQGSGLTNSFLFPFATYNVTYPGDVPVSNTTMTITSTVLPPADCNARVTIPAFGATPPICTTFSAASSDAAIFDVTCAVGGNQTEGGQCPATNGFNPLAPPGTSFHSSEDISNTVIYSGTIPTTVAPQVLTAPESTNQWVAIGVGFNGDCCTKGSGTGGTHSQIVLADFPLTNNTSQFAIPPYQFNGFTPPVGNFPGALNSAQAGQAIPFKWQVLYPNTPAAQALGFNGGPVLNLSFVPNGYLTLSVIGVCSGSSNGAVDDTIPVDTETNTGLMNQGNGFYQFNWKTPKSFNGQALAGQCLKVAAQVGDGVSHEADFQFKK